MFSAKQTPPDEVELTPLRAEHLCGLRGKWAGVRETEWCAFAMGRNADWLPVLGVEPFDRYDLEYQVTLTRKSPRRSGLPRMDAVGWHGDVATIVEAKVDVSPSSMLGGVGQLLYYSEIAQGRLGWKVGALVLLSPAWPLFLCEAIDRYSLPISLVQATPEAFYGKRANGVC